AYASVKILLTEGRLEPPEAACDFGISKHPALSGDNFFDSDYGLCCHGTTQGGDDDPPLPAADVVREVPENQGESDVAHQLKKRPVGSPRSKYRQESRAGKGQEILPERRNPPDNPRLAPDLDGFTEPHQQQSQKEYVSKNPIKALGSVSQYSVK